MQSEETRGSLKGKFEGFGAAPTEGLWDSISQTGGLADKFEGFGAAPTEGLWDRIAGDLDGRRRRIAIWWWTSGVAAVFLMAFGLYQLADNDPNISDENNFAVVEEEALDSNESENPQNQSADHNQEEQEIIAYEEDESFNDDETSPIQEQENSNTTFIEKEIQIVHEPEQNRKPDHRNQIDKDLRKEIENSMDLAINPSENSDQPRLDIELMNPSTVNRLDTDYPVINSLLSQVTIDPPKERCKGWELAANYSFWAPVPQLGFKKEHDIAYDDPEEEEAPTTSFETIDEPGTMGVLASADQYQPNAGYNPTYGATPELPLNASAYKPVNIAVVAKKNLSCRWSAYAGLSYSNQVFKSSYSSTLLQQTVANVNTVGVPLGAEFKFANGQKWDWKVRAGHLFEVPFVVNNSEVYSEISNLGTISNRSSARGALGSLETSIGFERELTDRLNLSADMGMRWYYLQRINAAVPLLQKNFWLGGTVGISFEI